MNKPFDFRVLSTTKCTATKKAHNCTGFIKANVLARQPGATTCFKCTAAGRRDAARKLRRKTYKAATAMGIPV